MTNEERAMYNTKLFKEAAYFELEDKRIRYPKDAHEPFEFYLGTAMNLALKRAGYSHEDINAFVNYISKEWDKQAVLDFADGMEE